MAFIDMYMRLSGSVPKIPIDLCKSLVNDAWRDVRRQNLWTFLIGEANWVTPGLITDGTAQTTLGSNLVVLDATAAAAVQAQALGPPTPIVGRQFRVGIGTIYNIWGWQYNTPSAGLGTLTLDRPYVEGNESAIGFNILQCYFPAPVQDFLGWITIRDMTNFIDLFTDKTRAQIDATDPQRSWYYFPTDVVYYQPQLNPASPYYGWPMFEMWGAPQYELPYQLYFMRRGVPLVNDTDQLPPAVGEDCVLALARMYAYEWAEANKGDNPRNVGPDFRYLIGVAKTEYDRLFKSYRKDDRETADAYFMIRRISLYGKFFAYYNSIGGTAYPGVAMGG